MLARMLVLVLSMATLANAQTTLRLHRTARIEPDSPLRLGDIATLTGPKAAQLGELVLLEHPEAEPADIRGWFRIEIGRVRDRLTRELGEAAGIVALSGSACAVRVRTPTPKQPPLDFAKSAPPHARDVRILLGLETVRGAIARELARILQTPPESLRLTFDDADTDFLDTPTAGKVVEVSPTGSSERMPIAVALYTPAGKTARRTVRVTAEVRRAVAVVSRVLARGTIIEPGDISAEVRWLPPSARVVTPEAAIGSVTRRRLDPGENLMTHAVEPPVMVRKGDMVNVRVVTAGLIVRREGYALHDGREGDVIEFAARHNPRTRFRATIVGRGTAVVWMHEQAGTPLAKTSLQPG